MRVLLFTHSLQRNGAPKLIFDAFEEMPEIELYTLAINGGDLRDRAAQRSRQLIVLEDFKFRPAVLNRIVRRAKVKLMLRHSFDLVYVNTVVALQLLKWFDVGTIPVLLHVHELESYLEQARVNTPLELVSRPNRYIVVSEAVKKCLVRAFNVNDSRISVVHGFVADASIQNALKNSDAVEVRPWIIGGCGSADIRKGHAMWLLMAASLIGLVGRDRVKFVWIGGGTATATQMASFALRLGIERSVKIVRETSDPSSEFAHFDVFAHTAWEDPCPLVIFEAMAMGIPCCCFANSGGAPEQIGDAGIIVDGFSPDAMAKEIAVLLENGQLKAYLSARGVGRVRDRFSSSSQIPKLRTIIGASVK